VSSSSGEGSATSSLALTFSDRVFQRPAVRARIRARLRNTSASQGRNGRSRSGCTRTAVAQVSCTRSSADEGSTSRAANRCSHAE
jgi:hypothetical protein